jgi:hypothetical protein
MDGLSSDKRLWEDWEDSVAYVEVGRAGVSVGCWLLLRLIRAPNIR